VDSPAHRQHHQVNLPAANTPVPRGGLEPIDRATKYWLVEEGDKSWEMEMKMKMETNEEQKMPDHPDTAELTTSASHRYNAKRRHWRKTRLNI
jgi:hypothetical protein